VEIYRKIRNTLRFLLANLNDYEYKDVVKNDVHALIDERLENLKIRIKSYYDDFSFINVIKEINNFITDLSAFYLSIIKDVLYAEKSDNLERLMIQNNLYKILEFLLISLAPIIPTTTDEAYSFFNKKNKLESIHLESFYKCNAKESLEIENQ
jgi:isoleucyl-tRNA synthetase